MSTNRRFETSDIWTNSELVCIGSKVCTHAYALPFETKQEESRSVV